MTKKILLVSIFSFIITLTFAQFGIKGGMNFSSFTFSNAEYKTGFHIGGVYKKPLNEKLFFQPGVLFTSDGAKLTDAVSGKTNVNMYSLETPLLMTFRPEISGQAKLLLDFGFYLRYGLFGKTISEVDNITYKYNTFEEYERFDLGLSLGAGTKLNNIIFVVSYQLGFLGVEKNLNAYNTSFKLSIGYEF